MENKPISITIEKKINASVEQIFTSFTNATRLRHWLCHSATLVAEKDGRIYLAWDNGYYAAGYYIELIPNQKIAFTWRGKNEPDQTLVNVTITADDDKNLIRLEHTGLRETVEWENNYDEIKTGWIMSLDNLGSVLETGIDLRISKRPLLGIFPAPYEDEDGSKIPVKSAIKINDVVEGLSADICGLQTGDILVKIAEYPITDWSSLTNAISQFKADDQVRIEYYRAGKLASCEVKLSPQILPKCPESPKALADELKVNQTKVLEQMMLHLRNITDEEASFKPEVNEWSIKEILAHLVHTEQELQNWVNQLIHSQQPLIDDEIGNHNAWVQATVSLYPSLHQLIELLRSNLEVTSAFISFLPEEIKQDKLLFWYLAYQIVQYPMHMRSHIEQIKKNLQLTRK